MKKNNGFTLLELIISLALTLIVISIIGTFFINITKTYKKSEISSNLQEEAAKIEDEIMVVGLQSEGIEEIDEITSISYESIFNEKYSSYTPKYDDWNGKIEFSKLKIKSFDEYYLLEKSDEKLILKKVDKDNNILETGGYPKTLSENIKEISIRSIDFRTNKDGNFKDSKAVELNITLEKEVSKVKVEIPLSTIIKFRNK